MKQKAGLWIDHRKAVMVFLTDGKEEIKEIKDKMKAKETPQAK